MVLGGRGVGDVWKKRGEREGGGGGVIVMKRGSIEHNIGVVRRGAWAGQEKERGHYKL